MSGGAIGEVIGPPDWVEAKFLDPDTTGIDLREYPAGKCPDCGHPAFEVCVNWRPGPGLDQGMIIVRCTEISWVGKKLIKLDGQTVSKTVITRCHAEYYLSPAISGRARGTVL
jgi:hypothetical protein